METNKIKAVELTRGIRDAHYEQLKGKTRAERIAFYRRKAQRIHQKVRALLPKQNTVKYGSKSEGQARA